MTSVSPSSGAITRIPPAAIVLDFNDALDARSVAASDLLIDGVAYVGTVTQLDGDTLSFAFPTLDDGLHTLSFVAGSILDVQQTPLDSFSSTFTLSTKGDGHVAGPGRLLAPRRGELPTDVRPADEGGQPVER